MKWKGIIFCSFRKISAYKISRKSKKIKKVVPVWNDLWDNRWQNQSSISFKGSSLTEKNFRWQKYCHFLPNIWHLQSLIKSVQLSKKECKFFWQYKNNLFTSECLETNFFRMTFFLNHLFFKQSHRKKKQ